MKGFNLDIAKKLKEDKDYEKLFQYCQRNCDDAGALEYLKEGIGDIEDIENLDEAIAYYNACFDISSVFSKMELGDIWEKLAECYRKKDDKKMMVSAYRAAIQIYLDIADTKEDDGHALYNIGLIYDKGANEIKDYYKAFKYYESALYRGFLGAAAKVAECYEYGKGVKKDPQKAFAIVEQYSQCDGSTEGSYYTLLKAIYYDYGIGVKRNPGKAVKIYQTLVESPSEFISSSAKYCLAICFYHGHGIKRNKNRALQLFRETDISAAEFYIRAIENKGPGDLYALSIMYRVRDNFICTKQNLERAFEFCKEAYELSGDEVYAEPLARYYFNGVGTPKNLRKAYELFSKCNKDEITQIIGEYYYYGCVQKQDFFEAIKRFDCGNRGGNNRARLFLALCYLNGNGVKRDIDYALTLLGQDTEVKDFYSDYAQGIKALLILSDQQLFEKYEVSVRSAIAELSNKGELWEWIFNRGEVDEITMRMSNFYLEVLQKKLEVPYLRRKPYLFFICYAFRLLYEYARIAFQNMKGGEERQKVGSLYKEIEILKEALQESRYENKYKDAIIQAKEQCITELSQQVHFYQEDMTNGFSGITAKLDEVNQRTKEVQEELHNLSVFVKEDLTRFIGEQKRQLSLEIRDDMEKQELKISQFCTEVSGYINAQISGSKEVDLSKEEEYLISVFGKSWDKLEKDSKISLVSAGVLWKLCADIKGNFDYSGICISATSALETELKKYFFVGFQNYLEATYGAPSSYRWKDTFNNWPEILLSTSQEKYLSDWKNYKNNGGSKPQIKKEKDRYFSLGRMPFLFGTKTDKDASEEQRELLKNRLNEYLSTFVNIPPDKSAMDIFLAEAEESSFIDKCERIRVEYRNRAAHDDILSEEQAKGCYHEVVGKIESYEYVSDITGILLQLYQYIK